MLDINHHPREKNMENTTATRNRSEILADMIKLPCVLQGKICEDKRILADGSTAVYHKLQWWHDGRNHSVRIPESRLAQFREAVSSGATARKLLDELTLADATTLLGGESDLKKKSLASSSRARSK